MVKESACNAGNLGSVPRLGRSPEEGSGYPLQCSCLENSMDRGAWQTTVHGVTKSWTQLSDFSTLRGSINISPPIFLFLSCLCKRVCVCVCVNPDLLNSSVTPTPHFLNLWYPYICSLRLCLYFCFEIRSSISFS